MMCRVSEAATERLPQAFVDCLLDSALEPVLDAAVERGARAAKRKKNAGEAAEVVRALLAVTVCDPACGQGSLLVAAAGRIARRVAAAREVMPSPGALRTAMREVVGSSIYGVDISGEAVDRAKDRLRQAADLPGMPPLFLDGRIRQGNALIGASPEQIENGIPDEAFTPNHGDDRRFARALRRANAKPAPGQATLFSEQGGYAHANGVPKRLVADAWCAAFCWAKTPDAPPPIVNQVLLDLRERGADGVVPATLAEIGRLSEEHRFFHWDLEFPDIFRVPRGETRWRGGFSCVLSAPPRTAVNRREHSAVFRFAVGSGAYPRCVAGLAEPGVSALRGDLLFAERVLAILAPGGRAGCAVAQGTSAAPGARHLLGDLLRRGALASLYDFATPGSPLCLLTFTGAAQHDDTVPDNPGHDNPGHDNPGHDNPGHDNPGHDDPGHDDPGHDDPGHDDPGHDDPARGGTARFAFRLSGPAELGDPGRSFPLTRADAALINPNTGALPAFRGSRDAALVTAIYRRMPVLWDETRTAGNPWKMRLVKAFPRVAATGLLRTGQELRDEGWEQAGSTFARDGQCMLPFYEPTMIDLFDHQAAEPRYWIAAHGPVAVQRDGATVQLPGVMDRLAELGWNWRWLCAWRASVHERAATAVFLPLAAVADALPLMLPRVVPPFAAALIAAQSSLVFDYVARQKADGVAVRAADWKQLPVPAPDTLEPHLPFLVPRVLELVYTAPDMRPLAMDLDDRGSEPFARDPERRASLRAELDAFFFHLYGISDADDVAYIIGALAADAGAADREEGHGDDARSARKLVLAAHDRMSEAGAVTEYETRIFPPPGHGPRAAAR
jgi:hypothetical protein